MSSKQIIQSMLVGVVVVVVVSFCWFYFLVLLFSSFTVEWIFTVDAYSIIWINIFYWPGRMLLSTLNRIMGASTRKHSTLQLCWVQWGVSSIGLSFSSIFSHFCSFLSHFSISMRDVFDFSWKKNWKNFINFKCVRPQVFVCAVCFFRFVGTW